MVFAGRADPAFPSGVRVRLINCISWYYKITLCIRRKSMQKEKLLQKPKLPGLLETGGKYVQASGQHRSAAEGMRTTAVGSGPGFRGVLLIYSSGSWVLRGCLLLGTCKTSQACWKIQHEICWYLVSAKLTETCHNLGYVCQLLKFVFKWGNHFFLCGISVLSNYYVHWNHVRLWR